MPPWYQDDLMVQGINIETETDKLQSYYDFLRRFVKQPQQVWMTFKPETIQEIGSLNDKMINFDLTGYYAGMPILQIGNYSPSIIRGPLTFTVGDNRINVKTDIGSGEVLNFTPDKIFGIDGINIQNIYDIKKTDDSGIISFGLINGNRELMYTFKPTEEKRILYDTLDHEIIEISLKNYDEIVNITCSDSEIDISTSDSNEYFSADTIQELVDAINDSTQGSFIINARFISEGNATLKNRDFQFESFTKNLIGIVMKLAPAYGSPQDGIRFGLYDIDGKGMPNNLLQECVVDNYIFGSHGLSKFEVTLDFEQTLDITKTYALIIHRTGEHDDFNYYNICVEAPHSHTSGSTLKTGDGIIWKEIKSIDDNGDFVFIQHPYFKTEIQGVLGNYPIVDLEHETLKVDFNSCLGIENNFEGYQYRPITDPSGTELIEIRLKEGVHGANITLSHTSLSINNHETFTIHDTVYHLAIDINNQSDFIEAVFIREGTATFPMESFELTAFSVDLIGTINTLGLDTIYARSTALPTYPLKYMNLCLEDGTILKSVSFKKAQHQKCYMMKISAEEINPALIPKLPFKTYLETSWYYFDFTKKCGFPQSSNDIDITYQPNDILELHAKRYGLFRRSYRDDIQPYEYEKTLPAGYPFLEEQDFWLEKRILEEYPTRIDKSTVAYLYDNIISLSINGYGTIHYTTDGTEPDINSPIYTEPLTITADIDLNYIAIDQFGNPLPVTCKGPNKIVELTCKGIGINNIEIAAYNNTISVKNKSKERIEIDEAYFYTNTYLLILDINKNSDILKAKSLTYSDKLLTETITIEGNIFSNIQDINTEGTYPTYGLMASEINSYMGVIPTIKNMSDYCLIWGIREYGKYRWAGDLYSPAVFRVDIPYPLPTNFKMLEDNEIHSLIDRCKKVGTAGIYSYLIKAGVSLNVDVTDHSLNMGKQAGSLELGMSIFCDHTPPEVKIANIGASLRSFEISTKKEVSSSFALSTQVSSLSSIEYDLSSGGISNVPMNNLSVHSDGTLRIDPTIMGMQIFPTKARNEIRGSGMLSWTNVNGALSTTGANYAYTATDVGTQAGTNTLVLSGFDFSHIPDNAIITGIRVHWSQNSPQPTQPIYTECDIRTNVGVGKKASPTGYGWSEWEYPLPVSGIVTDDTWGLNLTGAQIKSKFEIGLFLSVVTPGFNAQLDWCWVNVYYQIPSGDFITSLMSIDNIQSPNIGQWKNLTTLSTTPAHTTLVYDILTEGAVIQQTTQNTVTHLGDSSSYYGVAEYFTAKSINLTGIGIFISKHNTPTGNIVMGVYTVDNHNNPDSLIQQSTILASDIKQGENNFTFNINNLNINSIYAFVITKTGTMSSSNYYMMESNTNSPYSAGKMKGKNANGSWSDINGGQADLWFKIYSPINIFQNKIAPIDLIRIPYENIKIRGKLSSTILNVSPAVSQINVQKEVIYK
jgi:hypothetical protein